MSFRYVVAAAATLIALGSHAQVSVFPASPDSQTTVRVQVPPGSWHGDRDNTTFPDPRQTRIVMSANKITVTVVLSLLFGFNETPIPGLDLPLGQLPPGDYHVEVLKKAADGTSLGSQGTASFSVSPVASTRPNLNVTGLWWNHHESGWGVNIAQNTNGALFATWFLYGPDGSPIWYHMPSGTWDTLFSPPRFTGPVYRTTGPFLDGCPVPTLCVAGRFDPSQVVRTEVGSVTFEFRGVDYGTAWMDLIVDGKRTSRDIEFVAF